MRIRRAAAVVVAFALTGCYHAVINTGRPESTDVISIKWANGFVYGLVPPPVVETAARCTNGVAKVETQHSFLNMIAYIVTLTSHRRSNETGPGAPEQVSLPTWARSSYRSAGSGRVGRFLVQNRLHVLAHVVAHTSG